MSLAADREPVRPHWRRLDGDGTAGALWDTTITEILAGYYEPGADGKRPPESLYGSLKMWAHLQRQGIPVARRTVERIMRANGWRGASRARRAPRTTERDPAAARAPDLVGRHWRVTAPNLLVVLCRPSEYADSSCDGAVQPRC